MGLGSWTPRGLLGWLLAVLLVVLLIIVVAIILSALGGFNWHFDVGHFHWDVGVTRGA